MTFVLAALMSLLASLGQPTPTQPAAVTPPTPEQLATPPHPQLLRLGVLSFNIRYGTANDKQNAWPNRKDQVFEILKDERLEFIGLQEALRMQLDDIHAACPNLAEIGVGREDGKEKGEYAAILYRSDRWKPVKSGTFWLSETPDKPNSKSWNTACTRVCTFAKFTRIMPGTAAAPSIWVFNTHMDHISAEARLNGAKLIAQRIASRGDNERFVLTGDFNSDEAESAAQYFTHPPTGGKDASPLAALDDTFRVVNPAAQDNNTFHDFNPTRLTGKKIDYVLVQHGTTVIGAWIDRRYKEGPPVVSPSDHFPIGAVLQYELTPLPPAMPPEEAPATKPKPTAAPKP